MHLQWLSGLQFAEECKRHTCRHDIGSPRCRLTVRRSALPFQIIRLSSRRGTVELPHGSSWNVGHDAGKATDAVQGDSPVADEAEKRGQLIRHLEEALALADEMEDERVVHHKRS